jgi:hypothetical protein
MSDYAAVAAYANRNRPLGVRRFVAFWIAASPLRGSSR